MTRFSDNQAVHITETLRGATLSMSPPPQVKTGPYICAENNIKIELIRGDLASEKVHKIWGVNVLTIINCVYCVKAGLFHSMFNLP